MTFTGHLNDPVNLARSVKGMVDANQTLEEATEVNTSGEMALSYGEVLDYLSDRKGEEAHVHVYTRVTQVQRGSGDSVVATFVPSLGVVKFPAVIGESRAVEFHLEEAFLGGDAGAFIPFLKPDGEELGTSTAPVGLTLTLQRFTNAFLRGNRSVLEIEIEGLLRVAFDFDGTAPWGGRWSDQARAEEGL